MISSLSTYGRLLGQQNINTLLQGQMNTLSAEASSGTYADPAKQLGTGMSLLYNLQSQSSQQNAVQTVADTVGSKLDAMQTTLTSVATLVSNITTAAVGAATSTGYQDTTYSTMGTQGSGAMDQLLGMLNTTYNGQFMFSGQDSGTQTMAASSSASGGPNDALTTLLNNAVSANGGAPLSSSSLSGLQTSLDQMFSDSSGSSSTDFTGVFFKATDNGNPVTVSVGGSQTLSYDMKGSSAAFKNIFKGLSMLQMLNASSSQLDDSARSQLLSEATDALNLGQTALTKQTALLGAKQAQLQTIHDAQQSAASATQTRIANLLTVDPATTATNLSAIKNQLQASYEITSMISQLSFVNYMK